MQFDSLARPAARASGSAPAPLSSRTMDLSISVVSHAQAPLVAQLLRDLAELDPAVTEIFVTINVPEPEESLLAAARDCRPPVRFLRNASRMGFGANHNAAFGAASGRFFAVLNPDIRVDGNPFPALMSLAAEQSTGVVAPLVLSPAGAIENSARRFPSPLSIALKMISTRNGLEYPITGPVLRPDWVAGMFMLFRQEVYASVGGFDERYFLYYEDVDICWRLHQAGLDVIQATEVRVTHDARRDSHRRLSYLRHHVHGMVRFFGRRMSALFSS